MLSFFSRVHRIAADRQLRPLFPGELEPPPLEIRAPAGDLARQARAALNTPDVDVVAVMSGPLAAPHILFGQSRRAARYLAALSEQAMRVAAAGPLPPNRPVFTRTAREA